MKGIDFSNIALKMEATPRYPLHIQEGMAERFASLIEALGNNYGGFMRISGATVGIAGSNYTAAPGKVYYNGEIYTVDGNVVNVPGGQTAVWQIQQDYTRDAWHGDGTQKPTFYENKMVLVAGASGSGVANYNGGSTLQAQLLLYIGQDAAINTAINNLIAAAPGALNTLNELAAALGDDPNFATTVTNAISAANAAASAAQSTANTAVSAAAAAQSTADTAFFNAASAQSTANAKAAIAQENWIPLTLINGATNQPSAVFIGSRRVPSYYKDTMGRVWLTGAVEQGSSGVIAVLPVGYRPLNNISLGFGHSNVVNVIPRILTNGTIDFGDGSSIVLDGISFTTHH